MLQEKVSSFTLKTITLQRIARELLTTTSATPLLNVESVWLPCDLSKQVFDFCVGETIAHEVNQVLKLFLKNPPRTPLRHICLQNLHRTDVTLIRELVEANIEILTHLDVRGCRTLSKKFWCIINGAPNLQNLKTTNLMMPLSCLKLETLVIDWKPRKIFQRFQRRFQLMYYDKLLENVMPNLKHLDLSWCPWVRRLTVLVRATNLEVLILRNCDVTHLVEDICSLKELRILDISFGSETENNHNFSGEYHNPNYIFGKIISSLENLEYLDISGTNLDATVDQDGSTDIPMSNLELRRDRPLKFLGLYSTYNNYHNISNLPAEVVSGGGNNTLLEEAIKRTYDMPKTLRSQLIHLIRSEGRGVMSTNDLLKIQARMMTTVRLNEYFRFWAVKCTYNFLDKLENPIGVIKEETRKELFHALNRLIYSHLENEKVPELILCFTFQIYLKLLPDGESVSNKDTCREIMNFGKFLMSLKTMTFVYLKTEALLFRLLHRMSTEPHICKDLGQQNAVMICFDFFKTLQIFLGFSLSVRQTSEIVPLVWKSVLNFMRMTPEGNSNFIKYSGLSWIYAHLNWFAKDQQTVQQLKEIFIGIISQVEKFIAENGHLQNKSRSKFDYTYQLIHKLKDLIGRD